MTGLSHGGSRGRLLPLLGIGFGLAVTVGNAIGAGILRAPGEVAGHLPLVWLYMAAWVVGGLYALLGALQLAELGAMIPRSGGQYVFSRYALGEYPGSRPLELRRRYRLSLASSRSRCFRGRVRVPRQSPRRSSSSSRSRSGGASAGAGLFRM
jgi:amino acid transporter